VKNRSYEVLLFSKFRKYDNADPNKRWARVWIYTS